MSEEEAFYSVPDSPSPSPPSSPCNLPDPHPHHPPSDADADADADATATAPPPLSANPLPSPNQNQNQQPQPPLFNAPPSPTLNPSSPSSLPRDWDRVSTLQEVIELVSGDFDERKYAAMDILEIAEMKGITFPNPPWWPPQGYPDSL